MPDLDQLSTRGWEILRLSTDDLRVDIVPDLGATIVSVKRVRDAAEVLWRTPWGLRGRGIPTLPGDSEATMMDNYPGGWQTLFPNGGDTATANGVEWGYQGEARISPFDWDFVDDALILRTRLVRSPFELTKIITLNGPTLTVRESVRNDGAEALEVMWGQQLVLGAPLLSADTVIDAAATIVHPDPHAAPGTNYEDLTPWPRTMGRDSMINLRTLPGPRAGESRLAYLSEFDRPQLSVTNTTADLRVDLEWDLEAWPHLWYSLESGLRDGYPWYGDGYFLALSPNSSWPAHGLHDARRIAQSTIWIRPEEEKSSYLSLTVSDAT